MIEQWQAQRDRVANLSARAIAAREGQREHGDRLRRGGREWLGQAETLAWFGVTGFVWGTRVQRRRHAGEQAQAARELAGAAWLVLSWRRLPGRLRVALERLSTVRA